MIRARDFQVAAVRQCLGEPGPGSQHRVLLTADDQDRAVDMADLSRRAGVPLHVHLSGTNFQIKVWEALLRIPAGSVTTYGHIARQLGQPTAARAVGSAVGHNPIAVLIPCHRVIRQLGEFGNYRYGATRKKALLVHEFAGMTS